LSSRVFLYPNRGRFPTETALLELNADHTVRLTRTEQASGARREVVFDQPLSDIQIGGAGSSLTFGTRGGGNWRVDFSPYNAGQRVITTEQANDVSLNRADIGVWVARLRELGYPTRYSNARAVRRIAIVVVVIVVIAIAVIVIANLQRPVFG
jgi:hypothetical protein